MLAPVALANALHGVARLIDYQDVEYATLYLDRLERIAAVDRGPHLLSAEAARYLALWMSYEDTIRVADLKTRASRISRVRSEVQAGDGQIVDVTEYMHPRLQEIGETLPAPIGRMLLGDGAIARMLAPFFRQGRHVRTTSLRWFLMLRMVAKCRAIRRSSIRYAEEQERIRRWLDRAVALADQDNELAVEWVRCQRLVKGYGDTFERGLRNFATVEAAFLALPVERRTARWLAQAREAALGDDQGAALDGFLQQAA